MSWTPLGIAQLATCFFFAVLFLQSGIDKITDWKGNLDWLKGHFEKSPLRGQVPLLLGVVTIGEVLAGAACLVAAGMLVIGAAMAMSVAIWGLSLCAAVFLMLFTGQRIAKDYAGASTIAIYFGVVLFSLYLFSKA